MATRQDVSERGQALILFVGIFSLLIVFAALSIDQGLWMNHRRIAQKDADAAARAGAAQYIADLAGYDAASSAASALASANGAPQVAAPVTFAAADGSCLNTDNSDSTCARADCPTTGGFIPDAPSVEVAVPRPAPGLFTRVGLILFKGDTSKAGANDIGAKSTACLGSVTRVSMDATGGLPVEIFETPLDPTDNPNGCFDGGVPRVGMQCVLKYAAQNSDYGNRGYIETTASPDACTGTLGGASTLGSSIRNGTAYTCSVNTGGPCVTTPPSQDCTDTQPGTVSSTLNDWNVRLSGNGAVPLTCASDAFSDTFDYADGSGPVLGPPGLAATRINEWAPPTAGRDAPGTVYQQKPCSNPRVAVIAVTDSSLVKVQGFAAIFITGCFDENDPALTDALNDCGAANDFGGHTEIRGIVVRIFLTEGAAGDIGSINESSPLAIETTR